MQAAQAGEYYRFDRQDTLKGTARRVRPGNNSDPTPLHFLFWWSSSASPNHQPTHPEGNLSSTWNRWQDQQEVLPGGALRLFSEPPSTKDHQGDYMEGGTWATAQNVFQLWARSSFPHFHVAPQGHRDQKSNDDDDGSWCLYLGSLE